MPSRPDIPSVLLVLALALAVLFIVALNTFASLFVLFLGITIAIFLYAVYWGLVVRRGMAVKLYRHQALGMSLVSLGLLSIFISIVVEFSLNVPSPVSQSSNLFRFGLYGLLVFFWVDSSMRASQDMDPLSRDSLRWSKLRYVLWGLNFIGFGFFLGFLALTGNYGFFDSPQPGLASIIVRSLSFMPFVLPVVAGIVALPIGALRSKDRSFRRQLQWFALALLFLFGLAGVAFVTNNTGISGVVGPLSLPVSGYCFYRSTRALVPLSRISPD